LSAAPLQAANSDLPDSPDRSVKITPKEQAGAAAPREIGLLAPDTDNIDTPTTAVLDYGGYASRSRFYAKGGLLQYVNFGVFQSLNLGASLTMDGLIGDDRTVRLRAPNAQVKYRFYGGDRGFPSWAVGYDGQGYNYNSVTRRYNHRQRGFFIVASQELGLPGLMVHPSMNISDFDTNSFFGALPFSANIQDKVSLMLEWDNINNFDESRVNGGLRAYITPNFHLDFAVRSIGQGGRFSNGDSRGPERIVQLRYSGNF
jgi:hypothetical protein